MNAFSHPLPARGERAGVRGACVALLLAACTQAHAGLFDDEEARKQIAATQARLDGLQRSLEARLTTIEQQTKGQALDLVRDLEGIKTDVAKIRGQIEVLMYELTEATKRQKDLYVDLDSRMRKIEASAAAAVPPPADPAAANVASAAPGPAAAPPAPAPQIVPVTAQEQKAYDAALDQFKRGDYNGAIGAFQAFVKANPKSLLASSAQYWVGNAQFAKKDYRGAIAAQRQLIAQWPDSSKIPDALLNIATAQSELGDNASARRTLEELMVKFPQSDAAGKAKQRLGMR
ncbi:MAG: tol-pal system protein YbgF [Burkholderiales bacterium]|nr:tol-pal system protein YbgF [Burkholderiales bacterium]